MFMLKLKILLWLGPMPPYLLRASGTQLGLDLTYFVIRHLSLAGRFQLTGSDDFSLLTGDPNLEVFQIFIHLGTLTHP